MADNTSKQQQLSKKSKDLGKVDIVREGTRIILPESMPTRDAIAELTRQAEQDELDVKVMELIDGFPLDAAYAFVKALEHKYGWVNALPTPGFFGPTPPTMVGLIIDPDGTSVQIPWGKIGIPGVTGSLSTGVQFVDGLPKFCIGGTIKQKDRPVVAEIAKMTRQWVKEHSIYRGKAIRMRFPNLDNDEAFSPLDNQPKFMDLSGADPSKLVFTKKVERQVAINLWTPILNLDAVRASRVPLKRGILLHGRYGVGKTMLSVVTAKMAVDRGITFIDLEDSKQLPQAITFARQLGGMVYIFAEDIDRCDEGGSRSDAFNEIINQVDGAVSKSDEILVVYTTNHIERIHSALKRQGRIDKIIEITEPDAEAAERLIRNYAWDLLDPSEDLTEVCQMVAKHKFIASAIREVVEQSKLTAIYAGHPEKITAQDLLLTAEDTLDHMQHLVEAPKDDRSELEKFGDALGKRIVLTSAAMYNRGTMETSDMNQEDRDVHRLVKGFTGRKDKAA